MRGTIKVVDGAGGTGAAPSSTPAPTPTPTPSSPAPSVDPTASPAVGPAAIDIVDFAFDAASMQVPVGARVTWTNRGKAPHTVTASDGSFDSGTLPAGARFETTFAAAGEFAYACAIHPDMIATVTVLSAENPAGGGPTGDTPVSSDGSAARVANGAAAEPPPTEGPGSDGLDAPSTASRASVDLGGVGGIVATIGLVLAACVLFFRAVRGSARPT
jgi:plastocyanin